MLKDSLFWGFRHYENRSTEKQRVRKSGSMKEKNLRRNELPKFSNNSKIYIEMCVCLWACTVVFRAVQVYSIYTFPMNNIASAFTYILSARIIDRESTI